MKILVTGGAGFIGSNFIHYVLENDSEAVIVNLDLLTYAGNSHNLDDIKANKRYHFVKGNITNTELVSYILTNFGITHIVNFAAESHVDRSILNPDVFVETNVKGTLNLLNCANNIGVDKFLQVSTDEVYGSLGAEGYFTEDTPLAPNSPYSSSKAGADLLVRAYSETYGLNTNITRCSNNYGPYHFPEKLIPLMITNAMDGKELPIYGDGENIRDWLHVKDHCQAIYLVLTKGENGEVYNVGGHNERTNNQIVNLITDEMNVSKELITYVDDRLGHDRRYAIDASKLINNLGWEPEYTFDIGIKETIEWYQQNEQWWRPLKDRAQL